MGAPHPGVYSSDGRWYWNGAEWLPVAVPTRRRRTGLWALLAVVGCVGLFLIVAGAGFLYLVGSVNSGLQRTDASMGNVVPPPEGFPSDFPIYEHSYLELSASHAADYHLTYVSADPERQIADWYRAALGANDWEVIRAVTSQGSYFVDFQRRSDGLTSGEVEVDPPKANGVVTITIHLKGPTT